MKQQHNVDHDHIIFHHASILVGNAQNIMSVYGVNSKRYFGESTPLKKLCQPVEENNELETLCLSTMLGMLFL